MERKIVFLDIDGTLTEPGSNEPPESALKAVREAQGKGNLVFLCTGRNYDMLSPLLKYGFDGVIASSGGYIEYDGKVIYDCPMTEEQKNKAMEVLKKHGMRWRQQIEKSLNILPMEEYRGQPVYKIVFMARDREQLEEPKRVLENDFEFCVQDQDRYGIINGEVVNRKFHKGKAVERVCQFLQISLENTIAFGDSMNDKEMMEIAGISICMGNGSPMLKQIADDVCPAVGEDGLYTGFLRYELI